MTPTGKASRLRRRKSRGLLPHYLHLLKIYENLPPSAVLPVPVAAAVKGVSDKTIRRNYELIPVSDGRVGVRKGDLEATRKLKHEGIPRSACEGMTEAA